MYGCHSIYANIAGTLRVDIPSFTAIIASVGTDYSENMKHGKAPLLLRVVLKLKYSKIPLH
jgi:hypothetical protein